MSSIKTKIVVAPAQWDFIVNSLNAITTAAAESPMTKRVGVRVVVNTREHLLFMSASFVFYFKWFGLYTPPKTGRTDIAEMGRWRTMDRSIYTDAAHLAFLEAWSDDKLRGKEMRATRLCNMAIEDLDWRPSSASAPAPLMFIRASQTKGN
jgi:hypothetical protein